MAGAALILAAAMSGGVQASGAPPHGDAAGAEIFTPSNPDQIGLAEHLRRQSFVFYGAWWCPACRQQKSLFGQPAVQRLPYQECEKEEAGRQRCNNLGIRAYPTWIRGGERREGVLTLEELKGWSGYRSGGATPAAGQP